LKKSNTNIEHDTKLLVKAAENIISTPITHDSMTSNAQLTEYTLVIRQPGGEALPKMLLPSDTTVGEL